MGLLLALLPAAGAVTPLSTAVPGGVIAPKLCVRPPLPEERGKGGILAAAPISCMETIARIPRGLVLAPCDAARAAAAAGGRDPTWASELTAAALLAMHESGADEQAAALKEWVSSWEAGGWGDGADLGNDEVRWGPRDVTGSLSARLSEIERDWPPDEVYSQAASWRDWARLSEIGSLLATGSDNDAAIYSKFRMPCHPVVHRAGLGLAALTRADKSAALAALQCRGSNFRAMQDPLAALVAAPAARKTGSPNERRRWDVADALSRVLSRATTLEAGEGGGEVCAVVPLHERLAHCGARGENTKLIGKDPVGREGGDADVLLVATRDIAEGEALTRDYTRAPRLPGDTSDGPLRLLLQFGLPPAAWVQPDE